MSGFGAWLGDAPAIQEEGLDVSGADRAGLCRAAIVHATSFAA